MRKRHLNEKQNMDRNKFTKALRRIFDNDPELNSIPFEEVVDTIPRIDELSGLHAGLTVLVRTDLDVRIQDGRVPDTSRIEACAKTVMYCHDKGLKTVLLGHIGRGKDMSLEPVCNAMCEYIGVPIEFVSNWMDEDNGRLVDSLVQRVQKSENGTIFMLENTRKYAIEKSLWNANNEEFPAICAKMFRISKDIRRRLSEVEINEAIAASNLDFASSVLPLLMYKTALGFFIAEEMKTHIREVRKADLVVFSGLKMDKLDSMEGILERGSVRTIIVAGGLAPALLKAAAQIDGGDFSIGLAQTDQKLKAFVGPARLDQARKIVNRCRGLGVELVLPVDFVLDNGRISREIPSRHTQLDVGPETRVILARKMGEYAHNCATSDKPCTIFVNGVFGKYEDTAFAEGTRSFFSLLGKVKDSGVRVYVGGGEGRDALVRFGKLDDVTHVFTCGGSVLKSLTNKHIAFLKAMYIQNRFAGE